jgi:hypothetical protein
MQQRDIIHHYIKSLSKYLARLEKTDAEEVIREIESHIYDAIELQEQKSDAVDAAAILAGFGEPRELATQYAEHILAGAPPPNGFKAIQIVKKGVTSSLYYSMAVFGFSLAAAVIFLVMAKLFAPDSVGVWSAANGDSFTIAWLNHPFPAEHELLGYWLIPAGIVVSVFIAELTRRVLRVLKTNM